MNEEEIKKDKITSLMSQMIGAYEESSGYEPTRSFMAFLVDKMATLELKIDSLEEDLKFAKDDIKDHENRFENPGGYIE